MVRVLAAEEPEQGRRVLLGRPSVQLGRRGAGSPRASSRPRGTDSVATAQWQPPFVAFLTAGRIPRPAVRNWEICDEYPDNDRPDHRVGTDLADADSLALRWLRHWSGQCAAFAGAAGGTVVRNERYVLTDH